MRFSTIAIPALFSVLAAADPQTISVTDLIVRNINSSIESTSFTVEPDNVACSVSAYDQDITAVTVCGESKYRFYIEEVSLSNYNLTIYKELGTAEEPVELICRAGGSSASDYVCQAPADITYTLTENGQ